MKSFMTSCNFKLSWVEYEKKKFYNLWSSVQQTPELNIEKKNLLIEVNA